MSVLSKLAREIGHDERISILLTNLGEISGIRQDYTQAETYYQESLQLARSVGHYWLINSILCEMGEHYLRWEKADSAYQFFTEAAQMAKEQELQEVLAESLFGLARVAIVQDRTSDALANGKESLALFEKMGHYKANEVKEWLAELYPL